MAPDPHSVLALVDQIDASLSASLESLDTPESISMDDWRGWAESLDEKIRELEADNSHAHKAIERLETGLRLAAARMRTIRKDARSALVALASKLDPDKVMDALRDLEDAEISPGAAIMVRNLLKSD